MFYDSDAYVEKTTVQKSATGPMGLMGRQVAGKEFLDAYFAHGNCSKLVALVRNATNGKIFEDYCKTQKSRIDRTAMVVPLANFQKTFFPAPPTRLLYFPNPLDPNYAWARHYWGPHTFALGGLTHTLSTQTVVDAIHHMVTAPFEPYDSLICTSRAVVKMVRTTIDTFCDYFRERYGGAPTARPHLKNLPLGVNTDAFVPPTPELRASLRKTLTITPDELVVLFVGRLSFHAKANPFPMFHALGQAARQTGKKVHLVLSGWASSKQVEQAFLDGARVFAPNIRTSLVDSLRPEWRIGIWQVADAFASLADNVQESFGLTIIQAMSCCLPVVATDWDGYRDLVVDGETGYLVPTYMVQDTTTDLTVRMLLGEIDYDHFLAESTQVISVDLPAATEAFTKLLRDADLRKRMGEAGRQRVLDKFAWSKVIPAYEQFWNEQEVERAAVAEREAGAAKKERVFVRYPALETSFGGHPTRILTASDKIQAVQLAETRIHRLVNMAISSYSAEARCNSPQIIRDLMVAAASPCTFEHLDSMIRQLGISKQVGRATLAWMLKYGLLEIAGQQPPPAAAAKPVEKVGASA